MAYCKPRATYRGRLLHRCGVSTRLHMWSRFGEASAQLRGWEHDGLLVHRETVYDCLEKCVDALNGLFTGATVGKMLVKVGEPSASWPVG